MWKCKECGAEDSMISEGYEKNWVRFSIDENGEGCDKIAEENEETLIDFYECQKCKCKSRDIEDVATWEE